MKTTKRDVVQMLQDNNETLVKAKKQVHSIASVTHELIEEQMNRNNLIILALSSAEEIG